ncbi:MAG: hypothetical protein ACTTKU_07165 [Eggerthia catenaformis]|uniref:hypothetical protein n=1 Tax=Eggerthia catenaformis TaxID=31973 RepID=UPI003FA0E041
MTKVISSASEILFKRMLGKNYLEKIEADNDGFVVFPKEGEKIPLYFKDIRGVRTGYYLDENMPCRIVTILMNSNKKYGMGVSSGREEVDLLLRHYARYQLGGDIPEDIDDIHVVLQYGVSGYSIRLEKGYLIETENGHATLYLLNAIDYYEIDKISDAIDIKFRDKEKTVTLSMSRVTNIWLVLQILERLAKDGEIRFHCCSR